MTLPLLITYKEETKTLQQWADLTGIKQHTLRKRIVELKWNLDKAFTPLSN